MSSSPPCLLCLEPPKSPIVFSCGHCCCLSCFEVSGISICPSCRAQITKQFPAPWLESSLETTDYDSLETTDSVVNYGNRTCEEQYLSKPIVDFRGKTLRTLYHVCTSLCTPVVSRVHEMVDQHVTLVEEKQEKLQRKIDKLQKKLQKAIEQEEARVKQEEYRIQGLAHSGLTFLSLSTQTSDVLNQAIPVYRERIFSLPVGWSFGLSPTCSEVVHLGSHYAYIPSRNDFVYQQDGVIFTAFSQAAEHKTLQVIQIACSEDRIFVLRGHLEGCLITYDLDLNVIETCQDKRFVGFYLYNGKPQMIYCNGWADETTGYNTNFKEYGLSFGRNMVLNEFFVHQDRLYMNNRAKDRTECCWVNGQKLSFAVYDKGLSIVTNGDIYNYYTNLSYIVMPNGILRHLRTKQPAAITNWKILTGAQDHILCKEQMTNTLILVKYPKN